MRRLLGVIPALVLVPLLLAGCGDDDAPADDAASESGSPIDPSPSASTASPTIAPGEVDFELLEVVSETAAGRGPDDGLAVEMTSAADAREFAAPFSPELAAEIRQAVAAHPARDGESVYAAMVGLGCDVPTAVDVVMTPEGYVVTGRKVPDPIPECFAPVTSVAVVSIAG